MYKAIVVDDEKIEREGLKMLMERYKYPFEVQTAENGEVALELIKSNEIDILISDIKMPFMDGITLCEKVKEINSNIITIIVSAYGDFEFTREAIRLKVDDFILKPVIPSQFKGVLNDVCNKLEDNKHKEEKRRKLLEDYNKSNFFKKEKLLNELIGIELCEEEKTIDTYENNSKYVVDAIKLIEENYHGDIGLEWVAEKVFLSPGYLSGLFKQQTGKSLIQYLTICRLEKAKDLLENTNMKVVDIGEKVGYTNHSYFCLLFKKYFGATTTEIRKNSNVNNRVWK